MIIKSLSRKTPSFAQLVKYFHASENAEVAVLHNIRPGNTEPEAVIRQLEHNFQTLSARRGGNALYHEIIALEPGLTASRRAQIAALKDIARRYLEARAPDQLAYGVIHTDTPHLHIHLAVSSNAVASKRRVSLTKKAFAAIQRNIEEYQLHTHPTLGSERFYGSSRERKRKIGERETQASRREGRPSHKAQLSEMIAQIMSRAQSLEELQAALTQEGLRLYTRCKTTGVETSGGRRYRFCTLGLAHDWLEAQTRFDLLAERAAEHAAFWQRKTPRERNPEHEL